MRLTVEVDVRGFAFADKGGTARDTLEFLLIVAREDTGEFSRFDQQFDMNLRPETKARYERTGFPITREVPLAPGRYQARIVARDRNSGAGREPDPRVRGAGARGAPRVEPPG